MARTTNKEYLCCFGLHVRTATIIIGVWHLFLHLLALALLTIIVGNPAMVSEFHNDVNGVDDSLNDGEMSSALPTPLSKIDSQGYYRDSDLNYQSVDMSGFVCLCMIGISSLMIFGALKGKPSHLLPFFCLQLFEFAITTLRAANFLSYMRQVHRLIEKHRLPWREELLEMKPQALSTLVLVVILTVILLKAYAIGIVWRCYKYLTLQRQNMTSMLPFIIPDVSGHSVSGRMERDYSSLLPDYEEAIAQGLKQAPPPSYQVAMSANGYVSMDNTAAAIRPDIVNQNDQVQRAAMLEPMPESSTAAMEPAPSHSSAAEQNDHAPATIDTTTTTTTTTTPTTNINKCNDAPSVTSS